LSVGLRRGAGLERLVVELAFEGRARLRGTEGEGRLVLVGLLLRATGDQGVGRGGIGGDGRRRRRRRLRIAGEGETAVRGPGGDDPRRRDRHVAALVATPATEVGGHLASGAEAAVEGAATAVAGEPEVPCA